MELYDFSGKIELATGRAQSIYLQILRQLVQKNVRTRYKNSILGFMWSLLNPLAMMIILYVVFSQILKIKGIQEMDNFAVFMLCGLLPWNYFAGSVMDSARSIVNNPNLVKQVRLRRTILPLSSVFSNLVTFTLTFLVFGVFILALSFLGYLELSITPAILLIPFTLLLQSMLIIGFAFLFSSLTVKYRDIEHILEVILPFWFYLTPIFYPLSFVATYLRIIFSFNPMVMHVMVFRSAFLGTPLPTVSMVGINVIETLLVLCIGSYLFYLHEPRFAERI